MKKQILLLLALTIISVSTISAQENFAAEIQKPQTFKTLSKEYIQHQQAMLKSGENWWQPNTITYYREVWLNHRRTVYTYTNAGYVASQINDVYTMPLSSWAYEDKYLYEYDNKNNLKTYIEQKFNTSYQEWINVYKDVYEYHSNNTLKSISYMTWFNGDWRNSGLTTYTYNAKGFLTCELEQDYVGGNLVNDRQHTYTYDENDNITCDWTQLWENNTWEDQKKYEYTYDSRNNLTSYTYGYLEYGYYETKRHEEYTYDDNNNQITFFYQTNDDYSGMLKDFARGVQEYDSNNRLTKVETEYNEYGTWVLSLQILYSYDANSNNFTSLIENNRAGDLWVPAYKYEYTYAGSDILTSQTRSRYETNKWVYLTKVENIYENGTLVKYTESNWVQDYDNWYYTYTKEYIHDTKGNITDYMEKSYYTSNTSWYEGYRFTYEYDENGNGIEGHSWGGEYGNWNKYYDKIDITYNNGQSVFRGRETCEYMLLSYIKTSKPAGIEEIEPTVSKITIYPNPAKDHINVAAGESKIENVQIYNLNGKLLKEEANSKINISALSTGTYIIKVKTENGVFAEKVIVGE